MNQPTNFQVPIPNELKNPPAKSNRMTTTQMEVFLSKATTLLLLLLLLLLTTTTFTAARLSSQELDAALFALRSNGYTLFPNAITTSDLNLLLLSSQNSSSFTLFSPPDSLLFSLDLLSSARLYTSSLLLHVSPHFLSASDLLLLRLAYLKTLLPNRQVLVETTVLSRNGNVLPSLSVNGVPISVPDLFVGSNIAVHGLDGILVPRYAAKVDDGGSAKLGVAMAPDQNWCQSCTTTANPPQSWLPMKNMEMGTFKEDGGSGSNNKRTKHGELSLFKHLFT